MKNNLISRKIQLIGNRSYSISLPKEWVIENKLKEKDTLFFEKTKNNELLINYSNKKEKKKFEFDTDEISNISEFLMFCYIKNINNILLKSRKFSYEQIVKIRKIITFLEGYEIINETPTNIEIAFMFKDIDIKIKDIHRRIIFILNVMVDALQKKDSNTLDESEKNIDKLYHLSKRIIFSCYDNKILRQENNITTWEDLFFLKDISKKLEKIGDILYEYQKEIDTETNKNIKKHFDLLNQIINKKSIYTIKKEYKKILSEKKTDILINKINERCLDILENALALEYNKKYFS